MGEELTNENSVICQYCNKPYFFLSMKCPFCGKYRNDGYLIFTVPIKDNEGYLPCVNILFLFNKTFNLLSYIIFVTEF